MPGDGSPGTYSLSFQHDGKTREAVVCVPASYSSDNASPLLLNFHGFGGTAQDYMARADMRPPADKDAFLLAYPQGSLLGGSSHWNSAGPSQDNKSDADDFGYVEKLIDTIGSLYTLDANRVYAVGFSNGGMMSFGLACYRSDRIAAIATVSGAMRHYRVVGGKHEWFDLDVNGADTNRLIWAFVSRFGRGGAL